VGTSAGIGTATGLSVLPVPAEPGHFFVVPVQGRWTTVPVQVRVFKVAA
jgi:hypothetical protein